MRTHAGFSLVELMIALLLGMFILAGVASLLQHTSRSYREDERVLRLRDELRFGMAQVVADLEMTGFWGPLLDPASIAVTAIDGGAEWGADCGPRLDTDGDRAPDTNWAAELGRPLAVAVDVDAGSAAAAFPCLAGSDVVAGTDVVAIKRVAGMPAAALDDGNVYLRSNGAAGAMFVHRRGAPPIAGPAADWPYVPRVYYVRKTNGAGQAYPTLYRKTLIGRADGAPGFVAEPVADGIESLQLEFGIDADADGGVERYVDAPGAADVAATAVVRVTLLGRSVEPDPQYANRKVYVLGLLPTAQRTRAAGDPYYRKVATASVRLRNPQALRGLGRT